MYKHTHYTIDSVILYVHVHVHVAQYSSAVIITVVPVQCMYTVYYTCVTCALQVNSLLRSQSATNSPVTQVPGVPPATPPMAEAGTNTGQSLFWRPPSPLSPPLAEDSSASATPGSQYNGTSVCSSEMADLSVQTATSILSQGISEMNLDLQSYGT